MRYAIIYYSEYGQTKKISDYLKKALAYRSGLQDLVHEIDVSKSDCCFDIQNCADHYIIGTPIYVAKSSKKLISWIEKHHYRLKEKKVSIFTVSLNAADPHENAKNMNDVLLAKFIKKSRLNPSYVASFAGSLSYKKYGFFVKLIMKRISRAAGGPTDTAQDFELTNWLDVENFATAIQHEDHSSLFFIGRRLPTMSTELQNNVLKESAHVF